MSLLFEIKEAIAQFGIEAFHRYYGCYTGFVESVDDPDSIGRLQLKIPAVYGENIYKYWALPKGMFAGKGIGMFFIPNEGDKVWVSFENGDPRYPVWEFGYWAKGEAPEGAGPKVKIIKTTSGHTIKMDDTEGSEAITIIDKNENKIILDKEGISQIGENISLGRYKTSAEKAALGESTKTKISDICDQVDALCDALMAMTLTTPAGPSIAPPINSAQFVTVKTQIGTIKAGLATMLSNKVTLD